MTSRIPVAKSLVAEATDDDFALSVKTSKASTTDDGGGGGCDRHKTVGRFVLRCQDVEREAGVPG